MIQRIIRRHRYLSFWSPGSQSKKALPICLFVLFLGPSENMKEHLAFLASVSALFQSEGLIDLRSFNSQPPEAVLDRIRQVEKTISG